MPSNKLQQANVDFHIEIADISPIDVGMLCKYIQDYLLKNYNIIDCEYKVIDGE